MTLQREDHLLPAGARRCALTATTIKPGSQLGATGRTKLSGNAGQGGCLILVRGSVERPLQQRPFDSQCIQVGDQLSTGQRVSTFCSDSNCCTESPCRIRPNVRLCVDLLPVRPATIRITWACASYTASSVRGSWHRLWPVVTTWPSRSIPAPALLPAKGVPPAGRPAFTFGTDTPHTSYKLQATATTVPPSRHCFNLVDIGSNPSSACSVRGTKFRSLASDHALGHQTHRVEGSRLRFQPPCQAGPGRRRGSWSSPLAHRADPRTGTSRPRRGRNRSAAGPAMRPSVTGPRPPGDWHRRWTAKSRPPRSRQQGRAGRVPGWGPLPARSVTMRRHSPCSPAQRPAAGARRCRGRSCIANVGFEADRGR